MTLLHARETRLHCLKSFKIPRSIPETLFESPIGRETNR